MPAPDKLDMNPAFEKAFNLMMEAEQSLFITGRAGTGKSTLLEAFCKQATHHVVVLAPTGVAALNVKGQTIHSFFNFYVDITPEKIESGEVKPRQPKLYQKIKTLIIDEVSMLRADLLDCVDVFLRRYGPNPFEPFGGVQMIFVGDLYQLPPVVTNTERQLFSQHYASPFFFSAHVFKQLELEMIELDKIYRQKDQAFIDLLNSIRNNSIEANGLQHLNQRHLADFEPLKDEFFIHLTTTNKMADQINDEHLDKLPGKAITHSAVTHGDFGEEYYPTSPKLQFKVGAQIMLLNNDSKKRWVNGSIGIILEQKLDKEGELFLLVELQDTNKVVPVYAFTWEVFQFSLQGETIVSEPVGTFKQFPFRLAWAITIHKSQGKTFDKVVLDIGQGAFASGQVYVGLSRCTSFEGLVLKKPIKRHHIRTDKTILKFLTHHQYEQAAKVLSTADKMAILQRAILDKTQVAMTYLKPNDSKEMLVVAPIQVGMELYNQKKFPCLKATCPTSAQERMFHVGRILDLEIDSIE